MNASIPKRRGQSSARVAALIPYTSSENKRKADTDEATPSNKGSNKRSKTSSPYQIRIDLLKELSTKASLAAGAVADARCESRDDYIIIVPNQAIGHALERIPGKLEELGCTKVNQLTEEQRDRALSELSQEDVDKFCYSLIVRCTIYNMTKIIIRDLEEFGHCIYRKINRWLCEARDFQCSRPRRIYFDKVVPVIFAIARFRRRLLLSGDPLKNAMIYRTVYNLMLGVRKFTDGDLGIVDPYTKKYLRLTFRHIFKDWITEENKHYVSKDRVNIEHKTYYETLEKKRKKKYEPSRVASEENDNRMDCSDKTEDQMTRKKAPSKPPPATFKQNVNAVCRSIAPGKIAPQKRSVSVRKILVQEKTSQKRVESKSSSFASNDNMKRMGHSTTSSNKAALKKVTPQPSSAALKENDMGTYCSILPLNGSAQKESVRFSDRVAKDAYLPAERNWGWGRERPSFTPMRYFCKKTRTWRSKTPMAHWMSSQLMRYVTKAGSFHHIFRFSKTNVQLYIQDEENDEHCDVIVSGNMDLKNLGQLVAFLTGHTEEYYHQSNKGKSMKNAMFTATLKREKMGFADKMRAKNMREECGWDGLYDKSVKIVQIFQGYTKGPETGIIQKFRDSPLVELQWIVKLPEKVKSYNIGCVGIVPNECILGKRPPLPRVVNASVGVTENKKVTMNGKYMYEINEILRGDRKVKKTIYQGPVEDLPSDPSLRESFIQKLADKITASPVVNREDECTVPEGEKASDEEIKAFQAYNKWLG